MANCWLTQGFTLDSCSVSTGGVKEIWIVGGGSITGFTYDTEDRMTGATSSTGTTLFKVELKRGLSSFVQNINKNYEAGSLFFEQVLNIVLHRQDYQKRNQILLMSMNDNLQVLVKDNNNELYFLGLENGLSLSGSAETGAALSERNGYSLSFTGQEPALAPHLYGDLATIFADATVEL